MNKTFFILLIFLVTTFSSYAQFNIRGKITNKDNDHISFAAVVLAKDSVIVQSLLSDSTGYYSLNIPEAGKYKLRFIYVGYKDKELSLSLRKDTTINVQFTTEIETKGVEITASKPLIENKIDRIRFNVGNTDIVFGSNAWEVIKQTPLVESSEQNGLGISGASGAVVYINNRKCQLSGDALANYLKSMPATNIEAIEVMSTPSSKYDAGGGGGIIRIVLKENKEEGLKGSITIMSRQANFNTPAVSSYLNFQKKQWNIHSSIYANSVKQKRNHSKTINYFSASDTISTQIEDFEYTDRQNSAGADFGVDYQPHKNHFIGFLAEFSGAISNKKRFANTYFNPTQIDSLSTSENYDYRLTKNYDMNLNYEGTLDTKGKKISINLDYFNYANSVSGTSKTTFIDESTNNVLYIRNDIRSFVPQNITNRSAKIDFICPFNDKVSLETGLKMTSILIDNNVVFENREMDSFVKDTMRSKLFGYQEDIRAFYFIFNQQINAKWTYQIGSRIENTIANGYVNKSKVVDKNYTNIFPTCFLKYKYNDKNDITLAVTSRINRPNFWDMNPYRIYVTDKLYQVGNPYLLPSSIYRGELTYAIKNTYFIKLSSTLLKNDYYPVPIPQGDIIIEKRLNYGNRYNVGGSLMMTKNLTKWWKGTYSVRSSYIGTKGAYENITINNQSFFVGIMTNQSFTISQKKGLTCTVSIEDDFPATFTNTRVANRLYTNVRFRKSFWNGKGNLSCTINDLLKSSQDRYKVFLPTVALNDRYYNDTRSIAFSFSYQFGKDTVKDNKDRETGNKSEKSRI